jgi:hypothetical protein
MADEAPASNPIVETGMEDAVQTWKRVMDSESGASESPQAESNPETPEALEESDEEGQPLEAGEDEDAPEHEDAEQGEDAYAVKVNGEETHATLQELITGYAQNASYTQKSQTLAEDRRGFEQEMVQSRQMRDQAVQILESWQAQGKAPEHDEQYWENLKETDPMQYFSERDALRENQVQQQMQSQQQQLLQAQQAQEQEREMVKYVDEQRGKLSELIPEWNDNAKAAGEKQLIVEYGRRMGFSDEELDNAFDARAVATLRKAALYDALQEKRKGIRPVQRQNLRSGGNPGEPQQLKQGKARAKLQKTGRVEDAAPVFYDIIRSKN